MSGHSLCFGRLAAVLVLIGSGCGGGAAKLHKVNGKVTLDGQPLSGASVTFEPQDYSTGIQAATGKTGADGSYSLTTTTTGDGAMAGDYKVIITKVPEQTAMEKPPQLSDDKGVMKMGEMMMKMAKQGTGTPQKAKTEIHPDYSTFDKTILKMTVPPPGGHADFNLHKGGGS
jgi:hypothetical protein